MPKNTSYHTAYSHKGQPTQQAPTRQVTMDHSSHDDTHTHEHDHRYYYLTLDTFINYRRRHRQIHINTQPSHFHDHSDKSITDPRIRY